MTDPAVGSWVELLIDSSKINGHLVKDSQHRTSPTTVLRGTVLPTPSWMGDRITIKNSQTGVNNYVARYLVISINNSKVEHKPAEPDRVLRVTSSNGKTSYVVTMDGRSKKWSCNCAGWQFRGKCRHVEQAQKG